MPLTFARVRECGYLLWLGNEWYNISIRSGIAYNISNSGRIGIVCVVAVEKAAESCVCSIA